MSQDDGVWLSVLVPIYRVEAWLPACLDSVLSQWRPGIEVVMVDDASPDGSGGIAEAYRARRPDVFRVIRHPVNRGIAATRNTLLAEARGDFLWFLDSDDVLMPGAVDQLAQVLDDDRVDLVLCDFRVLREGFGWRHRLRGEAHRRTWMGSSRAGGDARSRLTEGLLAARQFHPWSKIARRAVWQAVRFPDGRCYEDVAIIPQLVNAAGSFRHVPRPWVGYRQRPGSILAAPSARSMQDLLAALVDFREGFRVSPLTAARIQRLVDFFCITTLASAASKLDGLEASPDDRAALHACYRQCFEAWFPDGGASALAAASREGPWGQRVRLALRAVRVRRDLRACGWA
jgi:hypothetical protein